jgi:hypothetical protein
MYFDFASIVFHKQQWWKRWRSKYRADTMADFFRSHFVEADGVPALLGSSRIRSKLLIVMRNATTGSPWPVSNHPDAIYNQPTRDDCNLKIPLWKLLRASTAAPGFFQPESIEYGSKEFLFVDGGITPFTNPSLIAVLMATLPQYRICWPSGTSNLHVISVGTGRDQAFLPRKVWNKINILDQFSFVGPALLGATSLEQDLVCRILGDCLHGDAIDREIGDLMGPSLFAPQERKFTYVRYNHRLPTSGDPDREGCAGLAMDCVQSMPWFRDFGRRYAAEHVKREHLWPL